MGLPEILIVREPISLGALEPSKHWHRTLIKGVADVKRGVVALGGDWHMDANTVLIADGSEQRDVWGFNIYPEKRRDEAIEYESLINIRPAQGNKGMILKDEGLQSKIRSIVHRLIPELDL